MAGSHTDNQVPRLGYQPALDGVRAVAVTLVLLYHGGHRWASGGFLGVDVFFVLSGFLITWLLVEERFREGGISIGAFYGRRVRRLLPALVLVLFAVAIYAVVAAPAETLSSLREDALATAGYLMNWRLVAEDRGYFDAFAAPSPLTHTWSLAVEEQWYLIWPLVLGGLLSFATGRRRIAMAAGATFALMIASAVWAAMVAAPGTDPSRAYYGTDTRAQELLAGALLALLATLGSGLVARHRAAAVVLDGLGFAGLAWVVWLAATVDSGAAWLFEGGMLGVGVAVCAIVVAILQPDGVLRRVLAWKPLVWVGLLSYGLYLWHYPVYVVLSGDRTGLQGSALLGVRLGVTLLISLASYRLVELPVRERRWATRAWVLGAAGGLAVAAVLLVAVVPVPADGPSASLAFSSRADAPPPAAGQDGSASNVGVSPDPDTDIWTYTPSPRPVASEDDVRVVQLGDSVSITLAMGHAQGSGTPPVQLWDNSEVGCQLFEGERVFGTSLHTDGGDQCGPWRADRDRWLREFDPHVVVILSGVWEVYDKRVDGRSLSFGSTEFDAWFERHLDDLIDQMSRSGAQVVLLGPPCNRRPESISGEEPPENDDERIAHLSDLYQRAAEHRPSRVHFIDLEPLVCPGGEFAEEIDDLPLRQPDGVHFTLEGAGLVGAWLYPQVAQLARG